ncbi:MAG: FG-GAP-like repeat-containing protein [Terriglobia bacterium]
MILRTALGTGLLMSAMAVAASRGFIPDTTFKGSSLTGWHTLGDADWKASNGEITGTPKSAAGGWLLSDQNWQDLSVSVSFRCTGECKPGMIVRAQKTADGMKGFFISLAGDDLALYRITLDAKGHETSREKLPTARSLSRFGAPQAPANGAGPARAGRGPAGNGRGPGAGALAAGRGGRGPSLHADDWNDLEFTIDADVLHGALNGSNGLGTGWTQDDSAGFGSVGLYVGGTAEVRFKDLAWKDVSVRELPKEQTSIHFRKQQLDAYYYSWGVAAADFNHDGILDVAAGPYYYLGPDYTKRREVYAASTFSPSSQFVKNSWLNFAADFTGDGWPDLIVAGAGQPTTLYVNPKGEPRRWDSYVVIPSSNTEISLLKDINGDGHPDLVLGVGGVVSWAEPNPANPTGPWVVHAVSGPRGAGAHGLGAGDVNGDGRVDILTATGWYEQPAKGSTQETWTFHEQSFGTTGGAEMAVYDVNGDGLADVVTSLNAHGFGLAWYEQKRDAAGKISFVQHMIMDDFSTKNAGGVTFTELHGSTAADIDGDGIPDFIVGKRFWSHEDSYTDPDPQGAPVLYWYRTVRNKNAPGGAEFVPELIDNHSGAGSQVLAMDLNGDKAMDIAVSTNRGTFIFWGTQRKKK